MKAQVTQSFPALIRALAPNVVTLVGTLRTTNALVGAPEEFGGFWLIRPALSWATTATLRVYVRTSDGTKAASVQLYDGDAAVYAAPQGIGATITSTNTTGEYLTLDISALLANNGGSGTGWLQLRVWSAGASAVVGHADLLIA